MITPAFSAEFTDALEAGKALPPKEAFQACLAICQKHNIGYEFTGAADNFLVHEENRSKLMLTPTKAHKVGDGIHHAGADFKALDSAFAFELSKQPDRRAMQIAKNEALVERANGLLAKVNYKERFTTCGTSHFTAFCKHANAGGKTPMPKIADRSGRIDVPKLKRNANFRSMLESGWQWQIFPAELDEAHPDFAKLAQRALNSGNSIRQDTSEIELACQATEFYNAEVQNGHPTPREVAIAAVSEGGSIMQGYVDVVFDFATDYGGGPDLPFLRLMDDHTKARGNSKPLGSQYWNQLKNLKFYSDPRIKVKQDKPLMRLSFAFLQSSMPDSKDGIASFVKDYDMKKAVSKELAPDVHLMEEMLGRAFELCEAMDKEYVVKFMHPLGDLLMRCALKACKKEKIGFEGTEKSIDELKAVFLADLSGIVGQKVEYDGWSSVNLPAIRQPSASKAAQDSDTTTPAFKCLADFKTVEALAANHDFRIGTFVTEKGFDQSSEGHYTILSFTSDGVHLQRAFSFNPDDELERVSVSLEILISRWMVKVNVKLPVCIGHKAQSRPSTIDVDKLKCSAFSELLKVDNLHSKGLDKQGIALWSNPTMLRSTHAISSGDLTLVPLVPLSNMSTKKPASAKAQLIHEGPDLYLVPLSTPTPPKGNTVLDADQLVVAYWLVGETCSEIDANMMEIDIEKGAFKFKCLVNCKDIAPSTPLLIYKAAVVKAVGTRLEGATVVRDTKRQRIQGKQSNEA